MSANLTNPIFTDETAAREYLEASRWPDAVSCPHCGSLDKITKMAGKSHRPGLYLCGDCRGNFSVTVGTVYERSHIPLHKWLLATHLMSASKKGVSAHQIHRMLGITYKSAWFMAHRIREAMKADGNEPMGGEGKTVEVDKTFIGLKKDKVKRRGTGHKHAVLTLVSRKGEVRSFHVDNTSAKDVMPILRKNIAAETKIMTDEAGQYRFLNHDMPNSHEVVRHTADEYVRGDVHTNTVEGFYSIFKRGMKGVYQHCDEKHLHRYLAEFDFRYSNRAKLGCTEKERADKALKGIVGKRLTYRRINERKAEALG